MKEWIEVGIKLATSYSKSVKANIAPLAPLCVLGYFGLPQNLGQNKWNIWITPPPISLMPKWGVFAT